jgi:phosphopantothenoylcysteine synthetase/decarboxylase
MKILLGITGGIAAYKACEIISLCLKSNWTVKVISTHNASKFVTPLTYESLSGNPVYQDTFDDAMAHIDLGKWADVMCIAPLGANMMAKLANGICDDMLSTTALALPQGTPFILCPAMNTNMWNHPATQRNLTVLEGQNNTQFILPVEKRLACGDYGVGGLAEPIEIVNTIRSLKRTS